MMCSKTIAAVGIFFLGAGMTHVSAQTAPPVPSGPQVINPGTICPDDRGQHVQAHGGGIIKYEGLYYWFGEQRGQDVPQGTRAVSCYSSPDLVHWKFHKN